MVYFACLEEQIFQEAFNIGYDYIAPRSRMLFLGNTYEYLT